MAENLSFDMRFHEELNCISVKWRGRFSADGCKAYFDALAQNRHFRTCAKMLHDGRECDLRVENEEVVRAARLPYVENVRPGGLRVAILVRTDLAYGMLRVFASIRSKERVAFQIFRDYAAAADWIALDRHDGELFDQGHPIAVPGR